MPGLYQRAKGLYLELKDLSSDARAARLAVEENLTDELRAAVDRLLDARDRHPRFVEDHPGHPEQINQFTVLRVLGTGAMGTVYLARQPGAEREVALKVLHPGLARGPQRLRFELEAETLGRLKHPGIAQLYGTETWTHDSGRQPFLVMEHVDGLPLTDYARRHDLPHRARLDLLIELCDVVAHAHRKGVVHRDLKPEHVLVTADGRLKVVDFGLARLIDNRDRPTREQPLRSLLGTIQYMSPEQTKIGGEIDTRADIYSLGMIGGELLDGQLPYDLGRLPLPAALQAVHTERPRFEHVSRDLACVLGRALAKSPDERYQTATEMRLDLDRYRCDQPVFARRPSPVYVLGKFLRRNATRLIFAGVVLGILATLANLLFHERFLRRVQQVVQAETEGQRREMAATAHGFRRLVHVLLTEFPADIDGGEQDRIRRLRLRQIEAALPLHNNGFADAQVRNLIAVVYRDLGEPATGLAHVRQAIQICDEKGYQQYYPHQVAACYDTAVSCLLRLEDYDEARRLGEIGLRIRTEAPPSLIALVDSHHWLAEIELGAGDLAAAVAHARTAVSLVESDGVKPGHHAIASQHDLLGRVLHAHGDLAAAREELARGLKLRRLARKPDWHYIAKSHRHLGLCLRDMDEHDTACKHFAEAATIWLDLHGEDHGEVQQTRELIRTHCSSTAAVPYGVANLPGAW